MENATTYYEFRIARLQAVKDALTVALAASQHFSDVENEQPVPVIDTDVADYVSNQLAKLRSSVQGEIEATRAMLELGG
jgi:hypothetical protein